MLEALFSVAFLFFGSAVFSVTNTVPTAEQRSGDFSALLKLGSRYQISAPAPIATDASARASTGASF